MSDDIEDRKEGETDRRSLIAAVAAAGAAVPLMAAPALAQDDVPRCGNEPIPRFVVDLGGVALPRAAASALNEQIRKAVLASIARAGFKVPPYRGPLPPFWWGIVLSPQLPQLPQLPTRPQLPQQQQ